MRTLPSPLPQVTPEPRAAADGWPPYSASFRPHEVAVRRLVGDFSDDWWARAQVSLQAGISLGLYKTSAAWWAVSATTGGRVRRWAGLSSSPTSEHWAGPAAS